MDPTLNTIPPQTTVTTAIVLQFVYWIISAFGLIFIPRNSKILKIILFYVIISLFFLLLSNPFLLLIEPLIPITSWSLTSNVSLFMFFFTNIFFLIVMIESTGKIFLSIYTPALSVLPALAIFLHESVGKIIFYTIIIGIYFLFNVFYQSLNISIYCYGSEERRRAGFVFISIFSLIVSVIIGTITK